MRAQSRVAAARTIFSDRNSDQVIFLQEDYHEPQDRIYFPDAALDWVRRRF
jgi:hypothetical protein